MFIADLHIHSKYSRATSPDMDIEHLAQWAPRKGIKLLGTGDFTHPAWFQELKSKLKEENNGIYRFDDTYFMLTAEVCNIFSWQGKVKKIHTLILSPNFSEVAKINEQLQKFGNLNSDGRPILDLETYRMVEIIKKVSPASGLIPAHIWTPHFSLFGANSGFDKIQDCFKEYSESILALETGLSSDPPMNRRLSHLDKFSLVSNSDAHSPARLGREANCFTCKMDYQEITQAIKTGNKFLHTLEFFPQEGKYHFDGHRKCGVRMHPQEAVKNGNICPLCRRSLTVGVLHRVEELADRRIEEIPASFTPFKYLIPLEEIIADAQGVGRDSQQVRNKYLSLVERWGGELEILLNLSEEEIRDNFPPEIGLRILAVREGKVVIKEGYDGVYGEIKVEAGKPDGQLNLF